MARLELVAIDENVNLDLTNPLANVNINIDDSTQFATLYLDNIVGIKVMDNNFIATNLISKDTDNLIKPGADGLLAVDDDKTDYLAHYMLAKG